MEPQAPPADGCALFETALGECGVAWRGSRLSSVVLPGGDRERTRARLRRVAGAGEAEPPPEVARACSEIAALLAGEAAELGGVAVDHEGVPEFDRAVYAVARTIAAGRTLTYGEIARRLGDPALARDVGAALGRNPTPLVVPCHRVVAADGTPRRVLCARRAGDEAAAARARALPRRRRDPVRVGGERRGRRAATGPCMRGPGHAPPGKSAAVSGRQRAFRPTEGGEPVNLICPQCNQTKRASVIPVRLVVCARCEREGRPSYLVPEEATRRPRPRRASPGVPGREPFASSS